MMDFAPCQLARWPTRRSQDCESEPCLAAAAIVECDQENKQVCRTHLEQ